MSTDTTYQPVFVFFCLSVCLFIYHLAAIPTLFRRLPQGVTVTVDHGKQHRPRGPAQTVEFSRGAQIQEGLESRVSAHLLAGGLVRQTPSSTPLRHRSSSELDERQQTGQHPSGRLSTEASGSSACLLLLLLPLRSTNADSNLHSIFLGDILSQLHKTNESQRDSCSCAADLPCVQLC